MPKTIQRRWSRAILGATTAMILSGPASAEEIRVLISQSPWLDSFIAMIDEYEDQSDNTFVLDVTPFGGMVEKTRNSLRAGSGSYDLIALNAASMAEFYAGGFLKPLTEIDPEVTVPENVLTFGGSTGWNSDTSSFSAEGTLMGLPINGNVQVLYYRKDLYEENGLEVPETWEQLEANTVALTNGDTYGFVTRGAKDSILYNFTPYLFSHGGSFFADPAAGDYSVTLNRPEGLEALETYIRLAEKSGVPNPGATAQAELIQLLSTGRAAQAVAVMAAYSSLNDPSSSIVAGQIGTALVPTKEGNPHSSAAGHWMAGISGNVSQEKQAAALEFLQWFVDRDAQISYVEAGGVPIRGDLAAEFEGDAEFDFLPAFSANAEVSQMNMPLIQGVELTDVIALELNRALIGEITPTQALNAAARRMNDTLVKAGYDVTPPTDL